MGAVIMTSKLPWFVLLFFGLALNTYSQSKSETILKTHLKLIDGYPFPSMDGSKLVFHSNRMGNSDIFLLDIETDSLIQLTNHPAIDRTPSISPDGQHIAFVSTRDGNYDVFIINIDGSELKNLTHDILSKDIHPYWSPDSQRIIFNSTNKTDNYDLYSISPDGINRERLRNSDEATHAQFSPDGQKIVFRNFFRTQDTYNSDIVVLDLKTKRELRLTTSPAFDNHPIWSPDAKTIVFESDRDSGKTSEMSLFSYSFDTGRITRISNHNENISDLAPAFNYKSGTLFFSRKNSDDSVHIVEMLYKPD